MKMLLLSAAALFLSLSTGCIPGEFFAKFGQVASVVAAVAVQVGDVSEKLGAVSATLAEKDTVGINELALALGGLGLGGALTGGSVFALRNNGRATRDRLPPGG